MSYKVLNAFKEKEHENTIYNTGDIYPKDNFSANLKRVEFLQNRHPEYGVSFLGSIEGVPLLPKTEKVKPIQQPKQTTKTVTTQKKQSDAE